MLLKQPGSCSTYEMDIFQIVQDRFFSIYHRLWYLLNPGKLSSFLLASIIILVSGLALNGNWLLVYVNLERQFQSLENLTYYTEHAQLVSELSGHFEGLPYYILGSIIAAYAVYFPVCCFIHWYFYIRQRDNPKLWKCQPKKFMSWEDEKHAVISGISVLTLVSCVSGLVSCYIGNGGYSTLYYRINDMGWLYYFLSYPCISLFTELFLYYAHRAMHFPIMYRNIHKWHHRYKQPTPFAATAMNPLEMLLYQSCIFLPIFTVPIHWTVFIANVLYLYYYNVLGHSGVKLESVWPWQPSTLFHDNHHQYFHVNFGFNLDIWDILHGTYRVKNRVYNENTFYGYGKNVQDVDEIELKEHHNNLENE